MRVSLINSYYMLLSASVLLFSLTGVDAQTILLTREVCVERYSQLSSLTSELDQLRAEAARLEEEHERLKTEYQKREIEFDKQIALINSHEQAMNQQSRGSGITCALTALYHYAVGRQGVPLSDCFFGPVSASVQHGVGFENQRQAVVTNKELYLKEWSMKEEKTIARKQNLARRTAEAVEHCREHQVFLEKCRLKMFLPHMLAQAGCE